MPAQLRPRIDYWGPARWLGRADEPSFVGGTIPVDGENYAIHWGYCKILSLVWIPKYRRVNDNVHRNDVDWPWFVAAITDSMFAEGDVHTRTKWDRTGTSQSENWACKRIVGVMHKTLKMSRQRVKGTIDELLAMRALAELGGE